MKGCVHVMIYGGGNVFCIDHGFDHNHWFLCKDKIFMGLIIIVEPLIIHIPVAYLV